MVQVLIVDDERIVGRCLQEQINWERLGCEVPTVCYDGNQALRRIEESPPDIVITDIRMPGMDGITLCKLLHERYSAITVFIISAYEDFEVAQQALRYNVKDYILKPLDRAGLQNVEEMVSRALDSRNTQQFRTALLSGGLEQRLEDILSAREEDALNRLMEMVGRLETDSVAENSTLWMNLMMPVIRRHCDRQEKLIYLEEKQVHERIIRMGFRERLEYVRAQYLAVLRGESDTHSGNVVTSVRAVVDAEFAAQDLSVAGLAERFHISPAYLGTLFTQTVGMGLSEYIREKRLSYACEQLRRGNKSISIIAQESGFSNVNYFTKVFRKHMGIPPAEYRSKFRM